MSKIKKTVAVISLAVLLLAGFYAGQGMSDMLSTNTAASIDVSELYENPESYDLSDADGAASVIIMEDLSKTNTTNAVTAVVFDFRGYDTLGESFVLFTAITGAMVILRHSNCENKRRKEAREA